MAGRQGCKVMELADATPLAHLQHSAQGETSLSLRILNEDFREDCLSCRTASCLGYVCACKLPSAGLFLAAAEHSCMEGCGGVVGWAVRKVRGDSEWFCQQATSRTPLPHREALTYGGSEWATAHRLTHTPDS